jgi:hypothetical protein
MPLLVKSCDLAILWRILGVIRIFHIAMYWSEKPCDSGTPKSDIHCGQPQYFLLSLIAVFLGLWGSLLGSCCELSPRSFRVQGIPHRCSRDYEAPLPLLVPDSCAPSSQLFRRICSSHPNPHIPSDQAEYHVPYFHGRDLALIAGERFALLLSHNTGHLL